ncbi:hypothetical protein [Streptomyces brevispora]
MRQHPPRTSHRRYRVERALLDRGRAEKLRKHGTLAVSALPASGRERKG